MLQLRVVTATTTHTAQRRATIPLTTLRAANLSAGDWIRLTTPAESVIAQAWPSLMLGEDEIVLSRIHALALGEPERVEVEKCGDVRWMTAKVVMIQVSGGGKEDRGEREVAWDLALLKEVLRTYSIPLNVPKTNPSEQRTSDTSLQDTHSPSPRPPRKQHTPSPPSPRPKPSDSRPLPRRKRR